MCLSNRAMDIAPSSFNWFLQRSTSLKLKLSLRDSKIELITTDPTEFDEILRFIMLVFC
uniref:Uncharacterized protein n=1 Tax=Arcella intermedia TaxID=1963864 RepID=A0A6B2LUK2_9EUKA